MLGHVARMDREVDVAHAISGLLLMTGEDLQDDLAQSGDLQLQQTLKHRFDHGHALQPASMESSGLSRGATHS